MFNLNEIENVYLAVGPTDLRKSIDGLSLIVQTTFKLDLFEKSLFVFCNKANDKIKIIHFDHGFWLYYRRLEKEKFKWPHTYQETIRISFNELEWLLNGHELRLEKRKFQDINQRVIY
ncbi:MAG: IS66 family insertion sequence element accessory protein TnpB [Candidatus Izemoplasmatales bacterium]|nr:IS66 family insertion sequence element accessory protein TnpB [Candidatus Izemoplasmatales bacterium]